MSSNRGSFIRFLNTPGHTGGCVCIQMGDCLFTGDVMINGVKPNTKLPGGNQTLMEQSLHLLQARFGGSSTKVYAGHGDPFNFDEHRMS